LPRQARDKQKESSAPIVVRENRNDSRYFLTTAITALTIGASTTCPVRLAHACSGQSVAFGTCGRPSLRDESSPNGKEIKRPFLIRVIVFDQSLSWQMIVQSKIIEEWYLRKRSVLGTSAHLER
jgi:hypothetical protein